MMVFGSPRAGHAVTPWNKRKFLSSSGIVSAFGGLVVALGMGLGMDIAHAQTAVVQEEEQEQAQEQEQEEVLTLESVLVTGTATKIETPMDEIPASVSVVTREDMERRGASNLNDAMSYTPGIRIVDYPGGQGNNQMFMRGFRTLNFAGEYHDGLRGGFNGYDNDIELYGVEQVDFLRGPASVLYGQGEPGGLLNLVTKRPTDDPFHEVELQVGNFDHYQGAFDLSGPVDEEGQFLFRATGLLKRSNTQIENIRDDREYFAPAFTWRPTDETSVTVLANYLHKKGGGAEQSYPASGTINDNPNGSIDYDLFLGETEQNESDVKNGSGTLIVDHRFNDTFAVHSTTRYLHAKAEYETVGARSGTLLNDRLLQRNAQSREQTSNQILTDNHVEVNLDTGPVYHTVLGGVDYAYYHREERRYAGTNTTLDVFNPVYGTPITMGTTPIVDTELDVQQLGFYAQEQAQIGGLTLTGNLRYDTVESNTKNKLTGTSTKLTDSDLTWRVGAIYAFDFGLSPFASYSTSFYPQVAAPAFDGSSFDPTEGEQFEVGLKYQPPGRSSFVTASLFHITQTNVLSADPVNTGYFLATGEVVSKGVELEGRVDLADGLFATGSYTYTDAKVTEDTFQTGVKGNQMVAVPKHQGSVWVDYTIQDGPLSGLGLGSGVRYIGRTYDASNTNKVEGYALVDASIRYDLGKAVPSLAGAQLKIDATNLLDTEYYTPGFSRNLVFAGNERRVIGKISYRW
jgi:iron complex outermembrane receptor protein